MPKALAPCSLKVHISTFSIHFILIRLWQSLQRKDLHCKQVTCKMAWGRKEAVQPKKPQIKFWLQVLVSLWMVGVLIWFFTDHKIQQWLSIMLADLLGR